MFDNFDMLAATLAHELKSPLAVMRANLDYMELCDTEKRYSKSCSAIKTQLEKTDGMIRDFVGLMLNAGSDGAPVDIQAVIEDVAADYDMPGFIIELPPGLIARGNAKLLGIVFSNAVKNALEAGAQAIRICGLRTGERISLTVTDDGSGISAETIEHLNDGAGYTTKKYGNGLGVAISRRIITDGGGSYQISNADGGGCEVRMELPAWGCNPGN